MSPYTTEHEQLRAAVRRLFDKCAGSVAVRAVLDSAEPYDRVLWRRMCGELGLAGLAVPPERGGSGYGLVELAVVLEETGRVNLPAPYLSTVLAGLAVAPDGGDEEVLAELAAGRAVGTVHLDPPGAAPAVTVTGGRASGVCPRVVDGAVADVLVASAAPGPVLIRLDRAGVRRTALGTLDLTRRQARITLDRVPARRLAVAHPGEWAGQLRSAALILLAAEQLGGAQRCLEMACAHATDRYQFGRPVGSFQAVKHLCADMLVELELARAVLADALTTAAGGAAPPELRAAASTAKVVCAPAFQRIAADTIQVLGGVGYTWEHDAHLFYRRAHASAQLFGSVAGHRERLAARAGLGERGAGD